MLKYFTKKSWKEKTQEPSTISAFQQVPFSSLLEITKIKGYNSENMLHGIRGFGINLTV